MSDGAAIRVVALAAQAEMALVRRDPVAASLLAQAARAGAGRAEGPYLSAAADLARTVDLAGEDEAQPARKVAQALCRAGSLLSAAAALRSQASEEIG